MAKTITSEKIIQMRQELSNELSNALQQSQVSRYQISKSGANDATLKNTLNGNNNYGIDTLLLIADFIGYDVVLRKR
jgi:uncharacterized Fe-S cluster-containing radical SAM superfamily enzyme